MRSVRMIGLLALALCGVGCGGGAAPGGDDAAKAAEAFLGELREGRVEPAWEATSAEFKSLMGLDALRDLLKKNTALNGALEFVGTRAGPAGLTECDFRGTNVPRRGKSRPVEVRVVLGPGGAGWVVEKLAVE